MRFLPSPPRTEGFVDPEAVTAAMRRWFWALAATDYDFTDPPRWTHDDNRMALDYGFQIIVVPDKTGAISYHVIPTTRGLSEETITERVAKLAPLDPLCAKAVAVMAANKLRSSK